MRYKEKNGKRKEDREAGGDKRKQKQYRKLNGRNFLVGEKKKQRSFLLNKEQKIKVWKTVRKNAFVYHKRIEKKEELKKESQQKNRKKEKGGLREQAAVWGSIAADEIEGGQELKEVVQTYEQIYDITTDAAKNIEKHISEKRKRNSGIRKGRKYAWKKNSTSDSLKQLKGDNYTLKKKESKEKRQRKEVEKRQKGKRTERKREYYTEDLQENTGKESKEGDRKKDRESSSGKSKSYDEYKERRIANQFKRNEKGSDRKKEPFSADQYRYEGNKNRENFFIDKEERVENRKNFFTDKHKGRRRAISSEKNGKNRVERNFVTSRYRDKYRKDFVKKSEERLRGRNRSKRRRETGKKNILSDNKATTRRKRYEPKVSSSRWKGDGERKKIWEEKIQCVHGKTPEKWLENDVISKRKNNRTEKRNEKTIERQKSEKKEERLSRKESDRSRQEGGRKKRDKSRKTDRKNFRLEERQNQTVVKKRMITHYIHMLQNDNQEKMSVVIKDIVVAKVNIAIAATIKTVMTWIIGKVILLFLVSLPFFFLYQLLLASPFAVFFPIGNLETGQVTAGELIFQMQKEFQADLKEIEAESSVDGTSIASVTLQYANLEGDGIPDTYYDILTVYAVKHNMGDFTLVLKEENTENLQEIFDTMCFYTIDDVESSYEDEEGESYYEIDRTITVTLLSYMDLIRTGYFNKEEEEILCELMKPENRKLMQQASGESHGSSLTESDRIEINKNLIPGEKGSEAVQVAMTKVGAIYSQAKRYEEGYYDCSSLTYRVYLEVGVDLSYQGTNVASYQARKMVAEGRAVAYEDLAPGDLIFWANEPCDSYLSITHVGLYAGNGKTIEASYSKGQVVYRNIWGVDEIVLCARPYD